MVSAVRSGNRLCVTEPVMMEFAAGARSPQRELEIRRLLARFRLLKFDSSVDFLAASQIYRRCAHAGFRPKGFVDCMIAAVAIREGAEVLGADSDFQRIADVTPLRLTQV